MGNSIIIDNDKHGVEMSMGSQCGAGYQLVSLNDIEDGFYTFPIIKGENELGVYTVQLVHGVTRSDISVLKLDFTPHEKSKEME